MFKREYKLKQHSIMIHFQADPENELNVCLRASEVKPKLDRFLIKKIGGRDKVKKDYKKWVRAENTNVVDLSLNYRMTIRCNSGSVTLYESKSRNNKNPENKLPDIFYGNMSNDKNIQLKYGVFWDDGITVKIQCFDKELSECIDKYIAEFFAVTNFGTMQDKGFGSFTVEGAKVNIPAVLRSNYSSNACYVVNIGRGGSSADVQNEIFDTIKQVYSVMKSGQNYVGRDGRTITGKYIRSFIYVYMHENHNIDNEKAYMKNTGVAPIRNTHEPKNTHEHHRQENLDDYRYVRALLGIGEQIEWIEPDDEQRADRPRKERITITDETNSSEKKKNIARFASPVFFKIIDGRIYITADEPDHRIYGRTFRFTNMGYTKSHDTSPRNKKSKTISTLTKEESSSFDMTDFLKDFKEYYNKNLNKLRKKYEIGVAK